MLNLLRELSVLNKNTLDKNTQQREISLAIRILKGNP